MPSLSLCILQSSMVTHLWGDEAGVWAPVQETAAVKEGAAYVTAE